MNSISHRYTITDAVSQCNVPVYFTKMQSSFANLDGYFFSENKNKTKTKAMPKT